LSAKSIALLLVEALANIVMSKCSINLWQIKTLNLNYATDSAIPAHYAIRAQFLSTTYSYYKRHSYFIKTWLVEYLTET